MQNAKFDQQFYDVGQNWPLGRSDLLLYLARFVERAEKKRGTMSHQQKVTHTRVNESSGKVTHTRGETGGR